MLLEGVRGSPDKMVYGISPGVKGGIRNLKRAEAVPKPGWFGTVLVAYFKDEVYNMFQQ
jgi:hypothetical protein